MKPLRLSLLALTCALASACATTGTNPTSAPPPVDAPVVADDAVAQSAAPQAATDTVEATTEPTTPAPDATQSEDARDAASADAETDFAAIYGNPATDEATSGVAASAAYDPWEKYNRRVHVFNSKVDRAIARPLARAYVAAIPQPIRTGIGNFFVDTVCFITDPNIFPNRVFQNRKTADVFVRIIVGTYGKFVVDTFNFLFQLMDA